MHRKTTENAVFTRNFEFIDPLRSFDRNMVFNYTNLTIRKGLIIWGKILRLKMEEFSRYEYADLVNIVNDDARAFVRLINQNILPFVNAVTTATVSIIIICRFNVYTGLFTLVVMPVMVLVNKKWIRRLRTLSKEARSKN